MRADYLLEIGMAGRSLNAIAFILQPERHSLSFFATHSLGIRKRLV
ncbi:hypothetical protein NDI42_03420 [Funiculus sociatus GB2-C1]|nr:hypothetical protein [Trichocoleus sp. FACHB-69]